MKTVTLDCAGLDSPDAFHRALAGVMDFPPYYGKNLDALFDCLTELPEMEIRIHDFYVTGYFHIRLKRVFQAAVRANHQLVIRFV